MTCAPSMHHERHPGGRPRTVSFSPEEMEKLGQEMIDWVSQYKPFHLSIWYSLHKGFTKKEWKAMIQAPEFLPYYERALFLVGFNYLIKESPIEPSLKHRWLRVYFTDLRDQEDEDAKFNSRLKAEEAVAVDENFNNKFDKFSKAITDAQESSKARKSEDIKSNADAKS